MALSKIKKKAKAKTITVNVGKALPELPEYTSELRNILNKTITENWNPKISILKRKATVLKCNRQDIPLHNRQGKLVHTGITGVAKEFFPYIPLNIARIIYGTKIIKGEFADTVRDVKQTKLISTKKGFDVKSNDGHLDLPKGLPPTKEIIALLNQSVLQKSDRRNLQILHTYLFFPPEAIKVYYAKDKVKRALTLGITPRALAYCTKDPKYIMGIYKEWQKEQKEKEEAAKKK